MRILFCRIGWARNYDGNFDDIPKNGGEYNRNNIGFEIYNFKKHSDGNYYGYVKMDRSKSIRIERIVGGQNAGQCLDDVYVVWVANGLIVGWYKNATVFRRYQSVPESIMQERSLKDHHIYNILAQESVLLTERERSFKVDGIGRSNIWYDAENTVRAKVKDYIKDYIKKYENFNK